MAFPNARKSDEEEQARREQAEQDERERLRRHHLMKIQNEDPGVFAVTSVGFRLELDLRVYFTPLMEDFGQGISFTRSLVLPFPPSNKVAIGGSSIDGDNILPPMGFRPADILWDMDRQLFLAHTSCSHSGEPIAFIPSELQSYLDNGWAIGSWQMHYDPQWKSFVSDELLACEFDLDDMSEWEEMEKRPPKQRPKEFNKLFGAVIQLLIKLHNNQGIAYAMYKTKKYFPTGEYDKSPDAEAFRQAAKEFNKMDFASRMKICKNVLRGAARFG